MRHWGESFRGSFDVPCPNSNTQTLKDSNTQILVYYAAVRPSNAMRTSPIAPFAVSAAPAEAGHDMNVTRLRRVLPGLRPNFRFCCGARYLTNGPIGERHPFMVGCTLL